MIHDQYKQGLDYRNEKTLADVAQRVCKSRNVSIPTPDSNQAEREKIFLEIKEKIAELLGEQLYDDVYDAMQAVREMMKPIEYDLYRIDPTPPYGSVDAYTWNDKFERMQIRWQVLFCIYIDLSIYFGLKYIEKVQREGNEEE